MLALALLAAAVLAVTIWFASAGWRTERAQAFDAEARAAFSRNDLDTAYQQERFAYAIAPASDRALSLGALAYLRDEYGRAAGHFARANGDLARLGEAAAGEKHEAARDRLGTPSDQTIRIGLAYAALQTADFDTVIRLLEDAPVDNVVTAYPLALAHSVADPKQSVQILQDAANTPATISHPDPLVAAFLNQLTEVPDDAAQESLAVFDRMSGMVGETSRRVARGTLLYELGKHQAALVVGRRTSEAEPEYRDAWNLRAAAALALGERDEAAQAIDISTEFDPSWGYSWYLKSELARLDGDPDKATQYLERAELLGYETSLD
ncbi:MAG: hypothetical protein M3N59_01260 [bacterium]|nr:hypothetical protein [bacterium]